ncbi:MAG: hypothetical protein Q9174_003064 [Haloplaca sp. 1 TL-2023]
MKPSLVNKIKSFFAWFSLVLFGLVQLLILLIIVRCMRLEPHLTDLEANSTSFAIYKNTRFEQCSQNATAMQLADCSLVKNGLETWVFQEDLKHYALRENKSTEHGRGRGFFLEYGYDKDGDGRSLGVGGGVDRYNNTWCALATCLADAKVLPTKPRASAFRTTALVVWCFSNIGMMSSIWALKQQIGRKSCAAERNVDGYESVDDKADSITEACERIGYLSWFFIVCDTAVFLFWWISWCMLAADPEDRAPISIILCLTTLRYAADLHYHPMACQFRPGSPWRRVLVRAVSALALFHWLATAYVVRLKFDDIFQLSVLGIGSAPLYSRYECLQDQIAGAPGTSSCTPQELCGREWLRSDPGFDMASSFLTRLYSHTFTVVSIVTAVYLLILLCRKWGISWNCMCSRRRHDAPRWNKMLLAPLISGAIILISAIPFLVLEGWSLTGLQGEATLAYDMECSVVHLTLSPELNYLDIGGLGRALRITKMWFGA